jgi:hypothetical protein
MDITYENFPLMQLLIEYGQGDVTKGHEAFLKAQRGIDEDLFQFAFWINQKALERGADQNLSDIPYEIKNKTLESSLAVFEKIGSRNHYEGAAYSAVCYVTAIGCKENLVKAAYWLEITEKLGGKNKLTIQIAKDIEERTLNNVAKKLRPSLSRQHDGP